MIKKIREKHDKLEDLIYQEFYNFVKYLDKNTMIENYLDNFTIAISDEVNGNPYQVSIVKFNTNDTFTGVDVNDSANICDYTIDDIYSTYDKIALLEILEELIIEKLGNIIKK